MRVVVVKLDHGLRYQIGAHDRTIRRASTDRRRTPVGISSLAVVVQFTGL